MLSSGPDLLGDLEGQHWFLISDLAGVLRGVTSDVGVLTLVAVLLVPASYLLLWRTAFGLRLRSCGENPAAADSLGVPVYRMKYIAVVISGALAGHGRGRSWSSSPASTARTRPTAAGSSAWRR